LSSEERPNENATQVGKATGQSTENNPINKEDVSRLANKLEGLDFPTDKAKILSFVKQNQSPGEMNIVEMLQSILTDDKQYPSVYEVEKQAGLLKQEK
jgi:Protein of unknown function (DUF2795)